MNGKIHWSRKTYISTKQEAWCDVSTYEVPYTGKADAGLMSRALTTGKHDKRPKPWTGACGSVAVVGVDEQRKVATVEVSIPIGD
jgi:hypothetical protein